MNLISKVAKYFKKVEIEFHLQLDGLNSILQLLVLAGLVVHKSIGRLEHGENVLVDLVH